MKIQQKSVDDLIPYARNARTHSDEQIAQIAGSIKEFGFRNPVLIDGENGIIAGHGRVEAARKLGLDKVPCIPCDDLTETQKRAYILADNRIAINAGYDEEMLGLELADLAELDVDLEMLGFDEKELNALLTETDQQEGEDETPELDEENVISKPGDVWLLGKHRLMCGDSTSADDVGKLLAGVEPHLMVTDPPYGVEYDATWRDGVGQFTEKTRMRGKVLADDTPDWTEAWGLFPGDVAYVWHAGRHASEVQRSLETSGLEMRCQIVWIKPAFAMSRGDYHWQHEPCWYAVRKGRAGHWSGDRKQTTTWNINGLNPAGRSNDSADEKSSHGTQKPVECMRRPIVNNSSPGQAVYEPFSGSGTTIIAAETTGRCAYAMEIFPAYCDMACRRYQEFSGDKAIHEETGKSFDEMVPSTEQAA